MNTENGNALLTVLITSLVMITIGLTIVTSVIGGTKRTQVRETEIDITYEGMKAVEEISTDLVTALQPNNALEIDTLKRYSVNDQVSAFFRDTLLPEWEAKDSIKCITLIDVSSSIPINLLGDKCISTDKYNFETFHLENISEIDKLTRAYEIVVQTKNPSHTHGKVEKTIRKRIILSPIPSFLKYAVGAGSTLYLNGSPNISGNIYANSLKIDKNAYYVLGTDKRSIETPFPSILDDIYTTFEKTTYKTISQYLRQESLYPGTQLPSIKQDSQFTKVQFNESFYSARDKNLEKLVGTSDWGLISYENNFLPVSNEQEIQSEISCSSIKVLRVLKEPLRCNGNVQVNASNLKRIPSIIASGDVIITNYNKDTQIGSIVSKGDITLQVNRTLSIIGDLISKGSINILIKDTSSSMAGNIFTEKDFILQGDGTDNYSEDDEMEFDSVIYAKGQATFSNLNIKGRNKTDKNGLNKDKGRLIVISQNGLLLTRMNEFQYYNHPKEKELQTFDKLLPNKDKGANSETIKPLEGFFYTEGDAELYGVGSLFYVHGGLFAQGDLTINAVRGNVKNINSIQGDLPLFKQKGYLSRFIVNYDKSVLLDKLEDLPKVEALSLVSDEIIVQ